MSLKKFVWSGSAVAIAALAAVMLLLATPSQTAEAAVNGISATSTTINPSATSTITIDADAGDTVRIVATTGTITIGATSCTGGTCTVTAGASGSGDVTITGNAGTTDSVTVTYTAPATGPATATITAIVGTGSRALTITIRGNADAIEFKAFNALAVSGSTCNGTAVNVIRSSTATIGQTTAFFCVIVRDSAGNRLLNQPVIFTTTSGTLGIVTDTTGASATTNSAVAGTLTAGTSGTSGTKATVTASSGGKSATLDILFGGDPASCTITFGGTALQTGVGTSTVVDVKDGASTPGPVPDAIPVAFNITHGGQSGANAAVVPALPTTINGKATTTLTAAIAGAIGVTATVPNVGPPTPINCSSSIQATGQVGTTPPPAGGAAFTGNVPARGSIGLLVVRGTQTSATLVSAFAASGCPVESLAILVAGRWLIFINGAPVVVNAAFPAQLVDLTPFFVRCA